MINYIIFVSLVILALSCIYYIRTFISYVHHTNDLLDRIIAVIKKNNNDLYVLAIIYNELAQMKRSDKLPTELDDTYSKICDLFGVNISE